MTPLGAARRLAAVNPWYENERAGTTFCIACGAYDDGLTGERHHADCPVLALPQIVAALEAAERVATREGRGRHACHESCPCQFRAIVALRAALKGAEVAA